MYLVMADAVITVEGSSADVAISLEIKKDSVPYFAATVRYPTLPVGDGKPDPETGPLAFLEAQWLKVASTLKEFGLKSAAPEPHKLRYNDLSYDQMMCVEILFVDLLTVLTEVGIKKSEKKGKKIEVQRLKGKFRENKVQGRETPPVHPKQEHSDKVR